MSSFKAISFAACLALAACGFQPLYKSSDTAPAIARHYADIEISNIPDREGQLLRNLLMDRFYTQGYPTNARYKLNIAPLKTDTYEMGIRKDATATRGEITITAHIILLDTATGQKGLDIIRRTTGSYNILDNQYATVVSRQAVTDRILGELSDTIRTEVDLYLARTP